MRERQKAQRDARDAQRAERDADKVMRVAHEGASKVVRDVSAAEPTVERGPRHYAGASFRGSRGGTEYSSVARRRFHKVGGEGGSDGVIGRRTGHERVEEETGGGGKGGESKAESRLEATALALGYKDVRQYMRHVGGVRGLEERRLRAAAASAARKSRRRSRSGRGGEGGGHEFYNSGLAADRRVRVG